MESRMDKYKNVEEPLGNRSSKNNNLYKTVYDQISSLEPIQENTNEVDITDLRRIVSSRDEYKRIQEMKRLGNETNNSITDRERPISRKVNHDSYHDINEMLRNAKSDSEKLQEVQKKMNNINYTFLKVLESDDKDNLDLTREIKFKKNINIDPKKESDEDLSLDIFDNLKPNENTMVTDPITDDMKIIEEKPVAMMVPQNHEEEKAIENEIQEKEDKFYSTSYKFSKKDFDMSDDFTDKDKSSSIFLKVLVGFILLLVLLVVTIYILDYLGIIKVTDIVKL